MADQQPDNQKHRTTAWGVIREYWERVEIYSTPMEFLQSFEPLPPVARHLFSVWWCDSEVCNGGFHQFFSNSTGILAPEAAEGFRAIGVVRCAELLETAIREFGEPFPRDRAERNLRLKQFERGGTKRSEWDPFNQLDNLYYAAKRESRLHDAMDDFARTHMPG